jgi:hypothetical protein
LYRTRSGTRAGRITPRPRSSPGSLTWSLGSRPAERDDPRWGHGRPDPRGKRCALSQRVYCAMCLAIFEFELNKLRISQASAPRSRTNVAMRPGRLSVMRNMPPCRRDRDRRSDRRGGHHGRRRTGFLYIHSDIRRPLDGLRHRQRGLGVVRDQDEHPGP